MKIGISLCEGAGMTENFLTNSQCAGGILTDARRVVRVRADGADTTAELAEALQMPCRGEKIAHAVDAACIDLHALALFDQHAPS